jgi:uncharacterized protein (TIGR02996 family)
MTSNVWSVGPMTRLSGERQVSEEDPFIQAATAHPEDEAPQLIYADWLEERGDPRGEYIRLWVEMARLPPHSDRYADLKLREKALRGRIDAKWLATMGLVPKHRPLFSTLPTRRVERWRLVEEFIDVWYSPLQAADGFSEEKLTATEKRLGFGLPAALREWYALAGRRKDVWSNQDYLVLPHALEIDRKSNTLIICFENQGCAKWGIRSSDLGQEDPPIIELGADVQASPTTSAFACQVLLYEVKFASGVIWAGAAIPERVARHSLRKFRKCQLPDRYWVASPLHFYEGTDILLELHGGEWVYVAAREESALGQLSERLRGELEIY